MYKLLFFSYFNFNLTGKNIYPLKMSLRPLCGDSCCCPAEYDDDDGSVLSARAQLFASVAFCACWRASAM